MFIDPIIMQLPEGIDAERFVIATYYCAAKPTTNMVKFAAALAIEQTCGTWLKVPGETPEVRERAIGRVVGVYEAPAYQIGIPSDVKERQFIVRIAYPWQNFGTQFSMMLSTVIGNISSSGKVKLIDLEFPSSFLKGFKGPKFGVEGIRDLLGVHNRPLLNNMIKPCMAIFFYYNLLMVKGAIAIGNKTPVLMIPMWIMYSSTLVSALFSVLYCIKNIFTRIENIRCALKDTKEDKTC